MLRSFAPALLFCCGVLSWAGCGSDAPPFVPDTPTTPEGLAQELAFRYERMGPVSRPRPVTNPRGRESAESAEKIATKSKENTKAEKAVTLEDLVDEIVARSRRVDGMKPEEALRKIAEIIEKDDKIKPTDRRLMAERLAKSE